MSITRHESHLPRPSPPRSRRGVSQAVASSGLGWPFVPDLLLLFPVALLAIGLLLLALVRRQIVEWQTLTGAGLFAGGLLAATIWVRWRMPRADPFVLA